MSFTLDTTWDAGADASNPVQQIFETDAGLLVVCLGIGSTSSRTGGDVRYGPNWVSSVPMLDSGLGVVAGEEDNFEIWWTTEHPQDLSYFYIYVPNNGNLDIAISVIALYPGVGNTAEVDQYGSTTGSTQNPSMSTASLLANDCIISCLASGYRNSPTAGSGFTRFAEEDFGNWTYGAEYQLDAGAAGAKTVAWTQSADDWGLGYVAFKAVPSGGSIIPVAMDLYRQRRN